VTFDDEQRLSRPVSKLQPSPGGLGDGSPRLWSAGGAALPTFGVPRLRRSDDVAESMSQPFRAGLKFGYRPYGPRSDLRSIFEFPHSPFSPCYGASGTKPLSRDNSQQCTVFSARSQRKNPGAKALIAVFFYGPTKVVP
jgi:hypothetical protein